MIKYFKDYLENVSKEYRKIRDYFDKCIDSIDSTNRYMLRKSCMYTSFLYITMIIVALFIIPGFEITPFHWTLLPFLLIYYFLNKYVKDRDDITTFQTSIMCLSFYFLLGVHLTLIETIASPSRLATWFPLILLCFPTIFIDHVYKYIMEETIMSVLFLSFSYLVKVDYIFRQDMFIVIAAYLLSLMSANVLLRVRSYESLSKDEIKRVSSMDPLTLILNKGALLEAINNYYLTRDKYDPCAFIVIDVDNFKHVNDKLGHNNGDLLLSHIGSLLKKSFRSYDIIGRFGGDEFIVFMPGVNDKSIVEMRCRSMQMMLTDFSLDPTTKFTLSIGAVVDCVNLPYDLLFRMADDALYESKQVGKNRCVAWTVEHNAVPKLPMLLLATDSVTEGTSLMEHKEENNYEIIRAYNGSDALKYLSQYNSNIKIAIIHIGLQDISGQKVINYIKTRKGFEHIRVLAVCQNDDELKEAEELKADIALNASAPDDVFAESVKKLSIK